MKFELIIRIELTKEEAKTLQAEIHEYDMANNPEMVRFETALRAALGLDS